ncbi:MAG: hypothetical protein JWP92_200 [Caulobacter sp.]|nr:hypothetical protein [Caulobacter sp.]
MTLTSHDPPHRRPFRLGWGRVAAAGVNLVLWSLIGAAIWAALRMVF